MINASNVYEQASQLPPREKAELVLLLLRNLALEVGTLAMADETWRRAWEQELRTLLERLERGETRLIDWDDALTDIRRSLGEG